MNVHFHVLEVDVIGACLTCQLARAAGSDTPFPSNIALWSVLHC